MRVTRDGMVFVLLASALSAVAMASGNNLLFLLVAPMWSAWLLQWPLGRLNLRGLRVRRALPAELYAGHEARGSWLLVNPRRWLSARQVAVSEVSGQAHGEAEVLSASGSKQVTAGWSFPFRGPHTLTGVRLSSTWPFGLVAHQVEVVLPAALLVYPRPLPGRRSARPRRRAGLAEEPRPGGGGEFLGLRSYREGDAPRQIHWPTTARVGRPMVVERAHEREHAIQILLQNRRGDAWERELSRACGEVQRAMGRGEAVGLRVRGGDGLEALVLPPGLGQTWRRQLLDTLARLPVRA